MLKFKHLENTCGMSTDDVWSCLPFISPAYVSIFLQSRIELPNSTQLFQYRSAYQPSSQNCKFSNLERLCYRQTYYKTPRIFSARALDKYNVNKCFQLGIPPSRRHVVPNVRSDTRLERVVDVVLVYGSRVEYSRRFLKGLAAAEPFQSATILE